MNFKNLFERRELIYFPSKLYSSQMVLKGNQVVLPQIYGNAYDSVDNQGMDGLFVQISVGIQEESKQNDSTYAFVYETSATQNTCFLSEDIAKKLKIQQGDIVQIQLMKKHRRATQMTLQTTSVVNEQAFTEVLPEIQSLLYQEVHKYRCLQLNDLLQISDFTLRVCGLVPNDPFVCLNESDVEVIISYGKYQEQIGKESQIQAQVERIEQKSVVNAVIIGTGEVIQTDPMQKQQQQYNPRDHRIKR